MSRFSTVDDIHTLRLVNRARAKIRCPFPLQIDLKSRRERALHFVSKYRA